MHLATPAFRITAPLRAVYAAERKGFAEIPVGTILAIIGSAPFEPFTIVDWNGCQFLVFSEDLFERGVSDKEVAA
jgi:hypothetical protein